VGQPLFVVSRSEVVTIAVDVPEIEAASVDPGDPARVRIQALGGRSFEGKVTRTAWALNPATRTLRTEVDLPNPEGVLRPGLYAYVSIIEDEHKDALTVPSTAVVSEAGKSYCVAVSDGLAKRREVTLGLTEGKRTEVTSGLRDGEPVVEANAGALADNQRVEVNRPPLEGSKP